jgi:hypothetical protein
MDKYIDASALGQVLLASIIGGVGLVALFALGLRGLSAAQEGGRSSGYVVAGGSFAVVLAGIVLGLYAILAA